MSSENLNLKEEFTTQKAFEFSLNRIWRGEGRAVMVSGVSPNLWKEIAKYEHGQDLEPGSVVKVTPASRKQSKP